LFGTTRQFLDSFNLKSLDELPPLSEIKDIDNMSDDLFATVPLLAVVDSPPADAPGDEEQRTEGNGEEHDDTRADGEPATSDAG
jgi:segregation and condensation protein B